MIKDLIINNRVTVISGNGCSFCIKAKKLLTSLNIKFFDKNLDNDNVDQETRELINKIAGIQTIPKIFVGKMFIGGCSDLEAAIESGDFKQFLEDEGIDTGDLK